MYLTLGRKNQRYDFLSLVVKASQNAAVQRLYSIFGFSRHTRKYPLLKPTQRRWKLMNGRNQLNSFSQQESTVFSTLIYLTQRDRALKGETKFNWFTPFKSLHLNIMLILPWNLPHLRKYTKINRLCNLKWRKSNKCRNFFSEFIHN